MAPGDTVSGREFGAFQTLYLNNHQALTELVKGCTATFEKGQDKISERLDEVRVELIAVNGRMRATEDRATRLEIGMEAAVDAQAAQKQAIDGMRIEVHQIREDVVGPVVDKRLTTRQKVGIGVGGGAVIIAVAEMVKAAVQGWYK